MRKTMILILTALTAVLLYSAAAAESGFWGDLIWNVDEDGLLTVTGEGDMYSAPDLRYSEDWEKDGEIRDRIKRAVIAHGVTSISADPFRFCYNLTEVTISDTVTSIARNTFVHAEGKLVSFHVDAGNLFLKDVDGVLFSRDGAELLIYPQARTASTFQVPEGVKSIGTYAFYYAESLTSVALPAGLEEIGEYAFDGCKNLSDINLPDGIGEIREHAFADCQSLKRIFLPGSLTAIRPYVFSRSGLTAVEIPSGVVQIENGAFQDCVDLSSVRIPESVTSIGESALCAAGLSSITLHDHVRTIEPFAFYWDTTVYARFGSETAEALCKAGLHFRDPDENYSVKYQYDSNGSITGVLLTSVDKEATVLNVPAFITSISVWDLRNCTKLSEINVDPNNEHYSSRSGVLFSKDGSTLIRYPAGRKDASYSAPEGVKEIGSYSFAYTAQLSEITLPEGVTAVAGEAFCGCSSLARISLPASLAEMGEESARDCFWECDSLAEIQVAEGNTRYAAYDGILYNKGLTVMEMVPMALAGDVVIPEGVEEISGFFGPGLTGITLPGSVKRICDYAFYNCGRLSRITSSEGAALEPRVFCYYGELGQVNLPASVQEVGELVFYNSGVFRGIQPDFRIASEVTEIGDEAFAGIRASFVYLPDYVRVGKKAFANCPNLRIVYITTSIDRLADDAFDGCTDLTIIVGHPLYNENGEYTDYCNRHGFHLIHDEFEWGEG